MKCQICNEVKDLQKSHNIPKYIGGTDEDGITILCEYHHKEYDNFILNKILENLDIEINLGSWLDVSIWQKEIKKCDQLHSYLKDFVKKITKEYFSNYKPYETPQKYFCVTCNRKIDIENYKFDNTCEYCLLINKKI